MKRLSFSFGILILVFIWIYYTAATDYNPPINSIIGDISYVKKFGHLPAPGTDKNLRVKTHLAYAENILRNEETNYLNKVRQMRRKILLDDLHSYWVAGEFPIHYGQNRERNFCINVTEGRLCAIGYLFERSSERLMTQTNNKYDSKNQIRSGQALDQWIHDSGLSKEEAALIQPVYN